MKNNYEDAPRYTDPDSLRPDVDERAKQELGFGLMEPYNTEDR